MQIRDIFATKIEERIEAVVKVADRTPAIVYNELTSLVVTPQWERHLSRVLEEYTDAFEREDVQSIGIWISGFFGSGKSLLMKVIGLLLQGGELQGEPIRALFLRRLPAHSSEYSNIERLLAICQNKIATSFVGGNLHAQQSQNDEALPVIVFKLFASEHGYTNNWPFAWAVEYHIDNFSLKEKFQRIAEELSNQPWSKLALDSDFYFDYLAKAAKQVLPDHFQSIEAVERTVNSAYQNGITPEALIDRLSDWCLQQDEAGRRHKLLIQLDELGQWIMSGDQANARAQQVQILAESASIRGRGRIWLAVTAHGDIQELQHSADQEIFAKINQRFDLQCKLSNDDIDQVVQERLLRKTLEASNRLSALFQQKSGEITDIGTAQGAQRIYARPSAESVSQCYPYLPWIIAVIPDVVSGIAQAIGRQEALIGANRTMIAVVQGAILDTPGLLDNPIGRLLSLADLYSQLEDTIPVETKTDINRILRAVDGATSFTMRVAHALFLLGKSEHIPCTLDNVVRAVIRSLDETIGALRPQVEAELERIVQAGYAKHVGENYVFLSTQQRSFQDRVRSRQQELMQQLYDLSQYLKSYDDKDVFRFEQVPFSGLPGQRKQLRVEIDGRVRRITANEPVTIHVYTPLQRTFDPDISDDLRMKQRSSQEPNNLFLRLGEVKGFIRILALAAATEEVVDSVLNRGMGSEAEREVAKQVREHDIPQYQKTVLRLLEEAVRNSKLFFRNTDYELANGEGSAERVRNTISQLLPNIYARFSEVPSSISNPEAAVRAALRSNATNTDLVALRVYKADGRLDESHPLLSTLRGRIPMVENDEGAINAEQLRKDILNPPYGWDGNCVKVGLALLLRNGSCRLRIESRLLADAESDEAFQALTKEQRFKNLWAQGVRSTLDISVLLDIRDHIVTVFDYEGKLTATAPTLNTALEKELQKLQSRAQNLSSWASIAHCPLPLDFESGQVLAAELLNSTAPSARLPHFEREWQTVQHFVTLLHQLQQFRNAHGNDYTAVERFFQSMINLEGPPNEVYTFLEDWRIATNERTITEERRWDQLMHSYHAAQQAVTNQTAVLRQEVQDGLSALEAELAIRVQEVGAPAESIEAEATLLATELQPLQRQLQETSLSLSQARALRGTLAQTRLKIQNKVYEMRGRYQTVDTKALVPPQEIYLNLRNILGSSVRISSPTDLEQLVNGIKQAVLPELEQQKIVIIE